MVRPWLIVLLCLAFGALQNRAKIQHWLHPPPPRSVAAGQVILYATSWCGYCAKTRRFFADHQIAYEEIDIEKTAAGEAAYRQLGGGGVPIVVVNQTTVIRGYDPDGILAALDGNAPR